MRQETITQGIIYYPNKTHFIFTPALVKVVAAGISLVEISIKDKDSERIYTERRLPINGEFYFSIERYLQIIVEPYISNYANTLHNIDKFAVSPFLATSEITLSLYVNIDDDPDSVFEFETDLIWGALDVGERYGGQYKRKWFINYPFTFNIASPAGNYFDVKKDYDDVQAVAFEVPEDIIKETASGYQHLIVDPSKIFYLDNVWRRIYVAIPNCLRIKDDIEGVGVTSYDLEIDKCRCGIYLRWVNRRGEFCYYLFDSDSKGYDITEDDAYERHDMVNPVGYYDGLNTAMRKRSFISQRKTLALSASFIDSETFDFLAELAQSPLIDMFTGYMDGKPKWERVKIVPASYSQLSEPLQDFNFSIELPKQNQQDF